MDDKKKLEISQKWQKRLNNCKKSVGVIKFNDIIFNLIFSNNRMMNQVVLKKKKTFTIQNYWKMSLAVPPNKIMQ